MAARVSHSQLQGLSGVPRQLESKLDSGFVSKLRPTGEAALFETDQFGFISSWSPKAEQVYGFDFEDIIFKHISSLYVIDDLIHGKAVHELLAVETKGIYFSFGWQKRKSGQEFWAYSECQTIKDHDGNISGYRKLVVETPRGSH